MPAPPPQDHVETCCRCGHPAEQPAIGCGHLGGEDRDRLPLCVDCLGLLLEDSGAFWDGLQPFGLGTNDASEC